ncbi:MAG: sensor histidine kinase [Propionibacteriaceae bacterium]|jgi:signal transduction histidine kinase|nr:sensor histidine kinase [Propionibacteriaceae bacterium]
MNTDTSSSLSDGEQHRPQRYPLPTDIAIAMLLFGVAMFPGGLSLVSEQTNGSYFATAAWLLTITLLCWSQLLRTLNPQLMLVLATAGALLHVSIFNAPSPAVVAVPFCVYSYARYMPGTKSRLVLLPGGIGAIIGPLRWFQILPSYLASDPLPLPPLSRVNATLTVMLVCAAAVIVPYLAGRMSADRVAQAAERRAIAQQQARDAALWSQEQARLAQMRVRANIARELHDIVAHSLSVMIVQADGGRAAARSGNVTEAVNALDTIGDTGREALGEMRRIVGVLRGEDNANPAATDFTPNPGLDDINTLVTRSGERVTLEVNGTVPGNIPPAVALTAYRIVQEGLTNFLKHAGAQASADVRLTYAPTWLSVSVSDDGLGEVVSGGEIGYGLRGMMERVTAVGGQFSAGPGANGGFSVQATLPLPSPHAIRMSTAGK